MASIDDFASPSNTLKAADLEGSEITLTIAGYDAVEFDEKNSKTGESYKQIKPVFSFEETEKTFVMNKTNREAVAYVHGKEMDDWIGKEITLYPTIVPFGDQKVEAIRVRVVKAGGAAPKFLAKGKPAVKGKATKKSADDESIPF